MVRALKSIGVKNLPESFSDDGSLELCRSDRCSVDLDDLLMQGDCTSSDSQECHFFPPSKINPSLAFDDIHLGEEIPRLASKDAVGRVCSHETSMPLHLLTRIRASAHRWFRFSRPPVLLCLHLGRRVMCPLSGCMQKADQHVSFPFILNIRKYMLRMGRSLCKSPFVSGGDTPFHYALRAVVVHTGSSDSGHYSSYCDVINGDGRRRWMLFSDEHVRDASDNEVLASKAYMLFYERMLFEV